MGSSSGVCRCGHEREAHEHFRRGTDCGICGAAECPRFRRDPHAGDRPADAGARTLEEPAVEKVRVEELDPST